MKDYLRITKEKERRYVNFMWKSDNYFLEIYNRLADLESKIESGEIDYVVDKDKEIARLTTENQRLKEEVAEQKSIAADEHATQVEWFCIACDYKAKNDELRETLSKMETVEKELRARLDNAVELPCVQCVITLEWIDIEKRAWHCFKQWVVLYKDSCDQIVVEHCTSKYAAEARLAELKGEKE